MCVSLLGLPLLLGFGTEDNRSEAQLCCFLAVLLGQIVYSLQTITSSLLNKDNTRTPRERGHRQDSARLLSAPMVAAGTVVEVTHLRTLLTRSWEEGQE